MFRKMYAKRPLFVVLALLAVGLMWAGLTPPSPVQAQQVGTTMHISDMGVGYSNVGGPNRLPFAVVDIKDEFGNPVNGATVTGNWSGCFVLNGASAVTQTYFYSNGTVRVDGRAIINGKKSSCWGTGKSCNWTFIVTNVTKPGMTYDPTANVRTWAASPCQ